jgi:hypothetical protein
MGGRELDSSGTGEGLVAGSCGHEEEPSRSTEHGEYLE